ncbi:hypothetical protein BDK51DRAFT_29974 [Blyttiomyces helicus]|uniref:Uncharacterized protein n=1 Tax=Blyttiomyces helicus TaxID=388810 RepID=A0A4P9WEA0_9FUNG|nr:hypothetical protein BDK51DRAFT_29974 [Blyttiomyces helicus]|eukprot:RKO90023.1 hypothetical protein BDK51DRAFT_29974 [Blyttiomyces helicus]
MPLIRNSGSSAVYNGWLEVHKARKEKRKDKGCPEGSYIPDLSQALNENHLRQKGGAKSQLLWKPMAEETLDSERLKWKQGEATPYWQRRDVTHRTPPPVKLLAEERKNFSIRGTGSTIPEHYGSGAVWDGYIEPPSVEQAVGGSKFSGPVPSLHMMCLPSATQVSPALVKAASPGHLGCRYAFLFWNMQNGRKEKGERRRAPPPPPPLHCVAARLVAGRERKSSSARLLRKQRIKHSCLWMRKGRWSREEGGVVSRQSDKSKSKKYRLLRFCHVDGGGTCTLNPLNVREAFGRCDSELLLPRDRLLVLRSKLFVMFSTKWEPKPVSTHHFGSGRWMSILVSEGAMG